MTTISKTSADTYDLLAPDYDGRYLTPSALAENEAVAAIVRNRFNGGQPRTLDVGCGTGLALDLGLTTPGKYVGVDPSRGMLDELQRKHPDAADFHVARFEDSLPDMQAHPPFELILSLFGSPTHVEPEALDELRWLLAPGGLIVTMCYKEGYYPDFYDEGDIPPFADEARAVCRTLGEVELFNNFELVVGP